MTNATLNNTLRQRLALDPQIGAGNFIHWAQQVSPNPSKPLLFAESSFAGFKDQSLHQFSLNEIVDVIQQYAHHFLQLGIKPKDPVLVWLNDGVGYFFMYCALNSIGAIPVLLNANLPATLIQKIFHVVNAQVIITESSRQKSLASRKLDKDITVVNLHQLEWLTKNQLSIPDIYPYQHHDDDPIMITHSSGTTGTPKMVYLTHGGFFYGVRKLLEQPLMEGFEKLMSALPSSHNSAMAYIGYALLSGIEVMVMENYVGPSVIKQIAAFEPTTVVAFPQTYVDLVRQQPPHKKLQSVNYWINSGDSAHKKHIKHLTAYGHHQQNHTQRPGSLFVDGLGSSEMGHTLFRVIHSGDDKYDYRCIGFPQPWAQAKVFDSDGFELGLNEIGFLGVKAPSVTPGYWNNTKLTIKSKINGFFLTGDVVKKDNLGLFYHLDRTPDVVSLADGNLYSVLAEEIILDTFEAIMDCSIVSTHKNKKKSAVIFIEGTTDGKETITLTTLNQCLVQHHVPGVITNMQWVDRKDIPTGITGKVLKRALRENHACA